MKIGKCFLLIVSLCVSAAVFAQSEEDAGKAKRDGLAAILDECIADVQNMKLPENRAVFYARIGSMVWLQDQKVARSLFRNAATELLNAQAYAESKRSVNPHNEMLQGSGTRQQILNTIAQRDAELALELLVDTRPAMVQRALETGNEKAGKISNFRQNYGHLAQNEGYMEQNFYRMAADQNPEKAIALLKQSLSKGLTNDTYNQLDRLAQKDADVASDMASQVVDKLLRASYVNDEQQVDYTVIQLTNSILNAHISRRNDDGYRLKFADSQMRDLASKLINAYLNDNRVAGSIGQSVVTIAEKLQPASVAKIKSTTAKLYPQTGTTELDAAYQRLMNNDTPAEEMLAAADKFPTSSRRQIYQSASNKLMGQGNWQAARTIITENFSEEDSENAVAQFDQQLFYNLVGQAKFAEAERVIDGLPEQHRIHLLVYLANNLYVRQPAENKSTALSLLEKARQLTNERPENANEMGSLMAVIGGYSQIDTAEAIRLFEGVMPKIMELTDAAAVINGFQVNSNVRDGEFIVVHGNPFDQYGGNSGMIAQFAKLDLDRTMNLIDAFKRPEIRMSLKLQMLEGSDLASMPISSRSIVQLPVVRRAYK